LDPGALVKERSVGQLAGVRKLLSGKINILCNVKNYFIDTIK
jgi:hypothetical protein